MNDARPIPADRAAELDLQCGAAMALAAQKAHERGYDEDLFVSLCRLSWKIAHDGLGMGKAHVQVLALRDQYEKRSEKVARHRQRAAEVLFAGSLIGCRAVVARGASDKPGGIAGKLLTIVGCLPSVVTAEVDGVIGRRTFDLACLELTGERVGVPGNEVEEAEAQP